MDVTIRIAGEAGQGVQTTGLLLAGALAQLGVHVLSSQSYFSRIRGGLNWMDVRLADTELVGMREQADVLLALTSPALDTLRNDVTPGGVVLFDGASSEGVIGVQFTQVAKDTGGSALMANTVAAGTIFAMFWYPQDALDHFLAKEFYDKPQEVIDANIRCAHAGYELAGGNTGMVKAPQPAGAPSAMVAGGEAIAVGAATAGVKFVSSYPMSPSTSTFTVLASLGDEFGILVEQAEDEIAAANMVCGAAYAGVPAMTTTSGGGFALMTEAVSLAGITELPLVILIAQRPGPATGLPTRTAQQDLKFAINAGHGEFVRAIFAPGCVSQACAITRQAFAQAHKYQTPVMILSDQYLQDQYHNVPPLPADYDPIDRHIVENAPADYVRYAVTASGVSPRAIPGSAARVVVDSDEHTEEGHLTEDLHIHLAQQDKRMRKGDGLLADALPPERYGPDDAQQLFICWGSTWGPCREAVELLNAAGGKYAMLHFAQVWPVPPAGVRQAVQGAQRVYVVEGNCTGQFAAVLREIGALQECEQILRYDGLPFTAEYIVDRVTGVAK